MKMARLGGIEPATQGSLNVSRSVLLLSYLFPPRGGAGVQRALKFAKYLPQFGWEPLVVANGSQAQDDVTKVQDPTLARELPADAVVKYTELTGSERRRYRRMQSRWRHGLVPTDLMTWWIKPAVRAGMELVEQHQPSAIMVTMSPFTSAQAGLELKKRTGLPLALDLRDPWALDETRIYPTAFHAWRDWVAMKRALREADLVIMNNPESARAAREAFSLPATKVVSLTNGFDAEDMELAHRAAVAPAPAGKLRIVHTGMFHTEWAPIWDAWAGGSGLASKLKYARRPVNLWTRTPKYLLAAMEQAVREGALALEQLELVLVGELSKADQAMVEASAVAPAVKMLGYRTHEESLGWVISADVLFLPLHTPVDGGSALIVPGKAYEYLGSGRPILAMGPPGDMRRFIEETDSGVALAGDDVAGAARALADFFQAKERGVLLHTQDRAAVDRFARRQLTRRLAAALTAMLNQAAHTPGTRMVETPEPLSTH